MFFVVVFFFFFFFLFVCYFVCFFFLFVCLFFSVFFFFFFFFFCQLGSFKGDCVLFMIELHRMRIVHAHLMVCELFYKTLLCS